MEGMVQQVHRGRSQAQEVIPASAHQRSHLRTLRAAGHRHAGVHDLHGRMRSLEDAAAFKRSGRRFAMKVLFIFAVVWAVMIILSLHGK
jgi:hypothetical protein